MDGRGRQDGAATARSRVFSGRQVPLEMGTVRVGGSGRPAPSVFSSMTLQRSLSASQGASTARSPIVTLEPHPRSPFHRRTELSTTVIRVSGDASSSRFQVKKTAVRGPRSPRVHVQRNQGSKGLDNDSRVSEKDRVYDEERYASSSMERSMTKRSDRIVKKLHAAVDASPQQRASSVAMPGQDRSTFASIDSTERGHEMEGKAIQSTKAADSRARQPSVERLQSQSSSMSGRRALALPDTHAGEGTFVSSIPSLTKLQSSFTAKELALFTHRLDRESTTGSRANTQMRYHVTSRPDPATAFLSAYRQDDNQNNSQEVGKAQKRRLSAAAPQQEVRMVQPTSTNHQTESSWRRVDSSIDHMYENPSIDLVQLHLLHSHHSASGQKKRKLVERERILVAASELREQQNEEQRRQEEQQQRKLRLQKMSESIRLQNQRMAMKARIHQPGGVEKRLAKTDRQAVVPQRKPPVPRLSGKVASSRHLHPKRTTKDEVLEPNNNQTAKEVIEPSSAPDIHDELTEDLPVDNHTTKRKSISTAKSPRTFKKKRQANVSEPTKDPAAIQAKEERRAIAREYMQLQKHSRQIWREKLKEQSQRERENRQQQLELVEANRLRKLRLSKKRAKTPEKQQYLELDQLAEDPTIVTMLTAIPDSPTPMLKFAVEAIHTHRKTSPHSRSSDNSLLDEPQLDNENIRAVGNVMEPESPQSDEAAMHGLQTSKMTSINSPGQVRAVEQKPDGDDRFQKLLQLREKAAALSARLSELRSRPNKSNVPLSNTPNEDRFTPISSSTIVPRDDAPKSSNANSEMFEDEQKAVFEDSSIHDIENIKRIDLQNDETSADFDARYNVGLNEHVARTETNVSEMDVRGTSSTEEKTQLFSHTNRSQVTQQALEFSAPNDILEVHEDTADIDFRSIGVYNIGVVWPSEQEVADNLVERKPESHSLSVSSDLSSSAPSLHGESPRVSLQSNLIAQCHADSDVILQEPGEAFETKLYEQMKRRLQAPSLMKDDEADEVDSITIDRRENREDELNNESNIHPITHLLHRYPASESRIVAQRQLQVGESNQSNAGLMRLLRETDDSLSVIDRVARRLYQQQREQAEQAKEKELQKRIDAEKQALQEKDMALEAVMATLTGKTYQSTEDDSSDAVDDIAARDDDDEVAMKYKRLEEIMEEIESERAREKAVAEQPVHDGSSKVKDKDDHLIDREKDQVKLQDTGRDGKQGVTKTNLSSSSAFWDQLVSESSNNEIDEGHLDRIKFERPRVAIDDSELIAQREARLREDDEQMTGHTDSSPRVHSPRTLSRMMMAAFGYHEAIYEAHIQLSTIEHAHELETVQTDTISLAQAFKEEMEHNATSHQLALDHATLEKKFDGDMQEVLQELEIIRQGEEKERALTETRTKQELKQANLRECSIQTETAQRADAATSAALYVDTSTSPVRFFVDASVQHETIESTKNLTSWVEQSHELEYGSEEESEDAYDETFEKESHAHTEVSTHKQTSTSEVPSIVEFPRQSATKNDDESEIYSIPSGGEDLPDGDDSVKSGEVQSEIDEKDESTPSAVESEFEEEAYDDESRNAPENVGHVSVSMEYGDDFEVSSPKAKVLSVQLRQEDEVNDEIEDERKTTHIAISSQHVDDIEEDVDVENSVINTEDKDTSEYVESGYYSSQFDDTSLVGTKKLHNNDEPVEKHVTLESSNVKQVSTLTLVGERRESAWLSLQGQQDANDLAKTYVQDLERRKQAEESLLHLRLQTIELKFQHELQELENEITYKQPGGRPVQELNMRKENLTVAYLAEKANVESLKAASTARYYQDLHAFKSLSVDWPYVAGRTNGTESGARTISHRAEFAPAANIPAPTSPPHKQLETQVVDEESDLQENVDDYSNDFMSGQDSSYATMAAPIEPSDEASDIEEARSISFEHSEGDRSVADVEEDLGESDVVEENPVPHTNEGEIPDATADEENQYDDEFASMSEGIIASEAIVSDPGEIVEDSEGAEMSDDNSVHDGSEYEDDFASMSENPVESAKESGMVSAEVDYEEQDVAKDSGANDVDDISEDEIVEDENSSQKFAEKFHSGEIATSTEELGAGHTREIVSPNEEPHYSEDVFESGHLEQHSAPSFEHNQSVSGVEGHSTSEEDSSTTKLLVAEVAKMQTLSKVAQQARKDDVDDKLARKKAKTEELLQAKELLFRHQKDVFRRDEEKRQVDHFAKMALGMDVESELRQAKAEISQLLAREFDALHQTYPMLKGSSSKTAAEVVPKLALPASEEPASAILTVLGKSSEKGSVDEYDDDYDVESFEDEQGGIRASIKASSFEVASKGGEIQELDESHKYVDDELENATSEVASEVPSHQSGDLLPSAVDEEEDYVDDEQDGKAIDEDYDGSEDYENDYENESFDDVQSSSAVLTEDRIAEVAEIGEESKADNAIVDDLVGKDEYQDDDEMYSDEGFDSASGSSAQEPSSTFALENKTIAASIEIIAPVAAEASTQEEELADAIESVTAQLEDERRVRPLDLVHSDYNTQGLAFENAADECRPLDTSVSVSLSRDEEEGLLTKSIEERKARLEVLRQKILDRKDEIILVQKQMRVERRKEQLAAEEKLLWDEMESVERLLHADETALALCRQRNRLDTMYLEARGVEHSVAMPHSIKQLEQESDLLLSFDYVEDVELDELQQRRSRATADERVAAASRRQVTRGLDLLEGYIYIEAAKLGHRIPEEPTIGATIDFVTVAHKSISDGKICDEVTDYTSSNHLVNEENQEQEEEYGGNRDDSQQLDGDGNEVEHASPGLQTAPWDLLAGYDFVEDVEYPSDTRVHLSISDLMASFDYVEIAEAVEHISGELKGGQVEDSPIVDLLASFDYVETTYKVSLSSSIEFIGEQLHTSEQNADEKQQAAEVHSDEDEDDNETSSNRPAKREPSHDLTELSGLISESLTPAGGTLAQLADFSENAGGDDSDVSVEESVKDLSAELDAMDLGDIDETVDSQTYQTSANETQPTVERREEELADRVATLLLDDLLQALDNDIVTSVRRVCNQNAYEAQDIDLHDCPNSDDNSSVGFLQETAGRSDDDFKEVGSEDNDSQCAADRDLDRSIDKASSLDASESYSMDYAVEDDRVSEQSHQMESPSSSVRADTSNGIPIERGINFASDTEHTQVSVVPAEGEIGENETSTDMESMIERVTDSMFATMFDTTMMSELRIWSHQHEAIQSPKREIVSTRATVVTGLTGTTGSRVGMVSSGIARELATQGQPKTRTPDIDLTQQVLDQINIVDGKLILPTFDTLEFETTQDAHALYDTIYELAQGCFDSLQQSAHDERNLDNSSMLAVIYRQVQAEIDELLEIRAQSEGELERQLRLLSDEPEITSSVLLSHNCLESNVSTMVAKVQTQLTRTTEALSTAQTPRYGVWPRTPTSRTKSTSVLSSLQAQQDEELQQRITSMILSDLLHDAGLP